MMTQSHRARAWRTGTMITPMRLFLAVTLPETVRASIRDAVAPVRDATPALRWVRHDTLHLTVKFLGEQTPDTVAPITHAAQRALRGLPAIDASIGGAGAFPNFRRPRAVWLGMHPAPPLVELATRLDAALVALGITAESRPFHPHVTVARASGTVAPAVLRSLEDGMRGVRQRWSLAVREVVLMQSELGRGGSTYTALATAPLVGAQDAAPVRPLDATRGGR